MCFRGGGRGHSHCADRRLCAVCCRGGDRCGTFRNTSDNAAAADGGNGRVAAGPDHCLVGSIFRRDSGSQRNCLSGFYLSSCRVHCNACDSNRSRCLFEAGLIRIGLRAHCENGGSARSCLLTEVSVCVRALEIAAVDFPALKIEPVVKHPDVRCVIQLQNGCAGSIPAAAGACIGGIQISAILTLDIIAAVGLFDRPPNRFIRSGSGLIADTREPPVSGRRTSPGITAAGRVLIIRDCRAQGIIADDDDILRICCAARNNCHRASISEPAVRSRSGDRCRTG